MNTCIYNPVYEIIDSRTEVRYCLLSRNLSIDAQDDTNRSYRSS